MLAYLRDLANATAQKAMHEMTTELLVRLRTDRDAMPDPLLAARYAAAERILDAVDAAIAGEQIADPEAPDYFAMIVSESELRLMDGNR